VIRDSWVDPVDNASQLILEPPITSRKSRSCAVARAIAA